jgi:hypothetical protein
VKEKNVEIMTEKEKHLNETNTFHRHWLHSLFWLTQVPFKLYSKWILFS